MMAIGCLTPYTHIIFVDRNKNLFTRVMACEHERVALPSGEEVVVEAIGEVHLRMHNAIVRKLRGVRYIPKMMRNIISLRRLEKIGYTMKTQRMES